MHKRAEAHKSFVELSAPILDCLLTSCGSESAPNAWRDFFRSKIQRTGICPSSEQIFRSAAEIVYKSFNFVRATVEVFDFSNATAVVMKRSGIKLRREVVLALGLAIISGSFAAVGINGWMSSQFARIMAQQQPAAPSVAMTTVVVAKAAMGLGTPLVREKLEEAPWPEANVPAGAYTTIDEFLAGHQVRVALTAIAENEPVLKGKASGDGERFGLATILEPGKKAITIRINDVVGVGGFVLPGDRVDVLVTNDAKASKDDDKNAGPYTDLLLQNMRVLAIDQTFDPAHKDPILGRTVTVEASLEEAQQITLASTIGSLSLVLRNNGSTAIADNWKRMTVADLAGNSGDKTDHATFVPTNAVAPEVKDVAPVAPSERDDLVQVKVVRATASTEYSVLRSDTSE